MPAKIQSLRDWAWKGYKHYYEVLVRLVLRYDMWHDFTSEKGDIEVVNPCPRRRCMCEQRQSSSKYLSDYEGTHIQNDSKWRSKSFSWYCTRTEVELKQLFGLWGNAHTQTAMKIVSEHRNELIVFMIPKLSWSNYSGCEGTHKHKQLRKYVPSIGVSVTTAQRGSPSEVCTNSSFWIKQ